MKIKDWSLDERPRERVMQLGVESVSSAELLAILIGSGTPEVTSVDLMRKVLVDNDDSLRSLGTMTRQELEKYNGIGPAKAVTIQAAMELGKRLLRESRDRKTFTNAREMYDYFRSRMMDLNQEECHVILLDVKCKLIAHRVISRGGISESVVDIRLILRQALLAGAVAIVFAHNHPSGVPTPSCQDDDLTRRLLEACRLVQIKLLDHIIVGDNNYFSYYEEGKL